MAAPAEGVKTTKRNGTKDRGPLFATEPALGDGVLATLDIHRPGARRHAERNYS